LEEHRIPKPCHQHAQNGFGHAKRRASDDKVGTTYVVKDDVHICAREAVNFFHEVKMLGASGLPRKVRINRCPPRVATNFR